jgi:hypothetical protein
MTQRTQDESMEIIERAAAKSEDYWPRVAEVTIEGSLDGRRIARNDIELAAEMATQAFKTALESRGYEVELTANVTYSYRAMRKSVG